MCGCFAGNYKLDPAPLGHAVKKRFCQCYSKHCSTDASDMVPALHGTDTRNYASIFENGLLIPGCGNNIKVMHGSAYGLGIYTAKLSNPELSQDFCTQPSMLVCCVINDACTSCVEAHPSYPIRFRHAKHSSGKHLFDSVDELDVWYERDDYAFYDIWSWNEWNEMPQSESSKPSESSGIVKHVRDSMVIFDPSYVLPLFVVSGSGWTRPNYCDCDMCMGIVDDFPNVVLHDRLMYWPRGWVARHGQRHMLSSLRSGKKQLGSCDQALPAKGTHRKGSHAYTGTGQKVVSRRKQRQIQLQHPGPPETARAGKAWARAALKREVQADVAEEMLGV